MAKYLLLPYELREKIWVENAVPKFISLHCEQIHTDDTPKSIPFVRFLTAGPSEQGVFLAVGDEIEVIEGLSVCRESRAMLSHGIRKYRPWRMWNSVGMVKNVMWDPRVDVVDFIDQKTSPDPDIDTWGTLAAAKPLKLFARQFPVEVKEVLYLNLSSYIWQANKQRCLTVIWPLIDFQGLRELTVVLDEDHERMNKYNNFMVRSGPWILPLDLETDIGKLRTHYELYGPEYHPLPKKPSVRVVEDKHGASKGQDLHIMLRGAEPSPVD